MSNQKLNDTQNMGNQNLNDMQSDKTKLNSMTCRACLKQGEEMLLAAGIEEAANDAWLLFSEIFQMSRARYYMDMNRTCDPKLAARYEEWIQKRTQRIPLQHIIGHAPFMAYEFYVNEHVLTPRADTEVLVEETFAAVKQMVSGKKQVFSERNQDFPEGEQVLSEKKQVLSEGEQTLSEKIQILDMCTGSGCIAVSLACMSQEAAIPCQVTAADLSEEALLVAQKNNEALCEGRVQLIHSNLFEALPDTKEFDIIVSNPPYIKSEEIGGLMPEVRDYEPRMALDGKEDGLYFYRKLAEDGWHFLKKGGKMLLEIGYDQGVSVPEILKNCGYSQIQVIQDLAGLDRVVTACKE